MLSSSADYVAAKGDPAIRYVRGKSTQRFQGAKSANRVTRLVDRRQVNRVEEAANAVHGLVNGPNHRVQYIFRVNVPWVVLSSLIGLVRSAKDKFRRTSANGRNVGSGQGTDLFRHVIRALTAMLVLFVSVIGTNRLLKEVHGTFAPSKVLVLMSYRLHEDKTQISSGCLRGI